LKLIDRYEAWWKGELTGRPLMYVVARPEERNPARPATPEIYHADPYEVLHRHLFVTENDRFLGDAFNSIRCDLGPGALALYLGAEPVFAWETVWYKECIEDLESYPPLGFNPDNKWWLRHVDLLRTVRQEARGRFRVDIPDLIENIDIYSAMRGPQQSLFDLMDDPELVAERVRQIDEAYFQYYDRLYDLLKDPDGVSSYTAFHIMGRGRVAKVQCDFSAMISPAQYREFVLPSLKKQVARLDHSLYHLDGPDAIRHVPAIMELENLDALLWTCGAGHPDGGCPRRSDPAPGVKALKKSRPAPCGR
jgi:5-methyltetrahydrofolate--homocysteine methyltransferase